MKINIGINHEDRIKVVKILNRILADEMVLLVKTKNYHWNVVGDNFSELHQLFDSQYESVSKFVDEVAERIRSLGEKTSATMGEFLKSATLRESTANINSRKMIENLLEDHQQVIRNFRKDLQLCVDQYGDAGTSDFLTGMMEEHEKMAWMLRAYLE